MTTVDRAGEGRNGGDCPLNSRAKYPNVTEFGVWPILAEFMIETFVLPLVAMEWYF